MDNKFYIPQEAHLKTAVHSIWQVDRVSSFKTEYIIPKGVVEIIFNFSDEPIAAAFGTHQHFLARCFINGFNRVPIRIQPPKRQIFFGIQLQPLAAKKLFKTPAAEFADVPVDLTLIDSGIQSLWHQLAEQTDFNKRVNIFCKWVESRSFNWQPREEWMNHFLSDVHQHDLSVKGLAGIICYSPRQLSRKIFEVTGMNTEEALHYKKYLHAVHLMHHSDLMLTAIAYQSCFSDQSHFIKSFRTYTQRTPGEYSRNKGYVKGHIYENVR
ncbi:MAG TPA: helix-turn-helix domain-containing protein [Chitinophagaceae bacterium]